MSRLSTSYKQWETKNLTDMTKHIIAGKFGPTDSPNISQQPDVGVTYLELLSTASALNFGIAGAIDDLKSLNVFPSELGLDLLILAAHVYAADTRISRDTESQDNWTREIVLVVPVSEVDRWKMTVSLLQRQLNFLTGDLWTVHFRPRPTKIGQLLQSRGKTPNPAIDWLSLFSGGLDSLIGAIDALTTGKKPLLISHAGDGATSAAQHDLLSTLNRKYSSKLYHLRLWLNFPSDLVKGVPIENTTRARSFLFFSLGIFAGTGFNKHFVLNAPENGFIALNVPLDILRLGALSTRTTHPFYMDCWNKLLMILGIDGAVANPYWNKTKGEMARECKNTELLKQLIPTSLSCSSPAKARWQGGKAIEHCGYCLPCLIRRAAVREAFGIDGDSTGYTLQTLDNNVLDTVKAEGQQIRSFQLASRRLKANPNIARILIHKPGPIPDSAQISELADVYSRGLSEVARLLAKVKTEPQ